MAVEEIKDSIGFPSGIAIRYPRRHPKTVTAADGQPPDVMQIAPALVS